MLFKSHFWDLGTGAEPLSDGGAPPKGRCPAYIAALVFARHVTVQRRQQPGVEPVFTAVRPNMLLRLDEARRVNAARYAAGIYPVSVSDHPVLERFTAARTAMRRPVHDEVEEVEHEEVEATPATARPTAVWARDRLDGLGWTEVAVDPAPSPTPSPSPPPAPEPEAAPSNEITILAFICKGLSRCPDPDKALN